ncbi:MAG: hypothetical protein C5S49_06110 [Candidatus Methanogaster sp.]|nr:MAG: hypothetical protein C5S49_06040 [ANME-2 cluster archaeon]KAF5415252.1 MAG: hypothetical protein C5S49_06110 [ANME-2 cluster archaeon]
MGYVGADLYILISVGVGVAFDVGSATPAGAATSVRLIIISIASQFMSVDLYLMIYMLTDQHCIFERLRRCRQ